MKPKIFIILGSTRENRQSDKVGKLVFEIASKREDADFEVVDLRDYPLPFYDEAGTPKVLGGKYKHKEVIKWAEKVAQADGFIFITPEYNHGYPAVLKNALDYIYDEWNNKPASFVSYGGVSAGLRSAQQLKQVVIELQMIPLRESVAIPFIWQAFDENGKLKNENFESSVETMLNQLIPFAKLLKAFRENK